jgi:hypothetical protein
MNSNIYRGGEEKEKFRTTKSNPPHRQYSPDSVFLPLHASSLIVPQPTKQKSVSQRHKPTSDEISIEKSIDEIFLDVGKLNLSSYDEIEMIRERLLQLKTIQFYGVLEIPYVLSPSTTDEDKATSIGGAPKKQRDKTEKDKTEEDVRTQPEFQAKLERKEKLLTRITQSTSKEEINELYNTEFLEISKDILNFRKDSASKPNGQIDFTKLKTEDKEALITLNMMNARIGRDKTDIKNREMRFMETISTETKKINKSKEEYNKELNSIFFKYENSGDMKRHNRDVSMLISQIKKLKDEIAAPTRTLLEIEPKYIEFDAKFAQLERILINATVAIDALQVEGRPTESELDVINAKLIQPPDPLTITVTECNKVNRLVLRRLITKTLGKVIFQVWANNLRYLIDLQKSLFLKGYKINERPLIDKAKYDNIMSKVDHKSIILEFQTAFLALAKEENKYIKFRYKPGQSPVTDPCHIFFFYRFIETEKELPEEKFGDFHLTIHLGNEQIPDRIDFTEGKIHLVSDHNHHKNKANLLPYIFTKTNAALPGENECMQLIPSYQPNAHHNNKVIGTGRIIVKVLNEYLQTLHIDLGGTSGQQDKKLIDEISSYLLQEPNKVMKRAILHNINVFENTIQKTMNQLAREMIEGFYLSKTVAEKKDLQIDKLLDLLTSINNFIQQQKTYAQEISISSTDDTTYRNNLKTIGLRIEKLKSNAHTARLQAEILARPKATRDSFTRLLNERTQAAQTQARAQAQASFARLHRAEATRRSFTDLLNERTRAAREPPAPAREPPAPAPARELPAPARDRVITRSKTSESASASKTEIPYSERIKQGETTGTRVASGRKNRKIKYTKKKYNKVSRKKYNKVSNKRYNKVSRKKRKL